MRLLLLHTDYIEYEAREKVGEIAEENVELEGSLDEALAAFIAVESSDKENIDNIVKKAKGEIKDVAEELQVDRIMVYPYAHLSDDLADPKTAVEVLEKIKEILKDGYQVKKAPFGWYKSFRLSCKGHPLSELSRQIEIDEEIKEEEEREEKEKEESEFRILTPDGSEKDPLKFEGSEDFKRLIRDELGLENNKSNKEPNHISLMQEKEFVDYDSFTDPGNFRFYPKGKLIRDLLSEYADSLVLDYGGMPVETPIMYNLDSKPIEEHSRKFGERQYRFPSGDKKMMLRFAACFGQFSALRDMYISSGDLPLRMYERASSFRREQRGELSGLKRLRGFTMPDMHTACKDIEQAKEEFRKQAKIAYSTKEDLNFEYVIAFRATQNFYNKHRNWIDSLVEEIGDPLLVEILPERKHYWSCKIDFAIIDSTGEPIENPTVQIDVESAERFDIKYHDKEQEKNPILLHYSPTGSIERSLAASLETASKDEVPILPVWLSPTQVRFIPVGDEHVGFCEKLADEIEKRKFRADIDDRNETVGKRIRKAEEDWVPFTVVIGEKETKDKKSKNQIDDIEITVRTRGEGEKKMKLSRLINKVENRTSKTPKKRRYEPRLLSSRPKFQ